ncbi:hypothetical protein ACFQU2_08465 [Siccirubricoccus deserti]
MALANMPSGSRPEMLRMRRAEVELALLPLLSRRVEVRRLVLVAPDLLLETDKAGQPNWAFAPPGAAPAPALPRRRQLRPRRRSGSSASSWTGWW